MSKTILRIASLIVALAMILGNTIHTQAQTAGSVYYISPTGSDSNPGTASAPFRTFAKATSVLTAGSALYVYPGVYNQQLRITNSGTSTAGITIQGLNGKVIIDVQNAATPGLDVRASYVTVAGLEVRNSREVCVNLQGSNITANGLVVHDCSSHGIQANNSSNVQILNSGVYHTVLSNAARTLSGGWGSAIKVRASDNVLIQGNIVYNNYGEGLGMRGTNVTIRANNVYDNYSVNIYINSENALVERNFVYCNANTGFERDGAPASGISLGEEFFEGWGARLNNAKVLNNIVAFCKHGVRYNGAEAGVIGGGLKNTTIAYNTLYGSTNSAIGIVYGSAQTGNVIANNIFWQAQNKLSAIDNPVGITFQNNLWKVEPPAALRSPGDMIGDPQISGDPIYLPESYRPANTSIAAGASTDVGVTSDFYARQRGPTFDMGAIQFTSGSLATVTAVPVMASSTPVTTSSVVQATATSTVATIPVMQATATSTVATAPVSQAAFTSTPTTAPVIQSSATAMVVVPTFTSAPPTVISTATEQPNAGVPQSVSGEMWISRSELASRPTSGQAWENMRSAAYGGWEVADLKNQDTKHAIQTLAGALVYARTGDAALRAKVRDGILAAKRTLDQSGEWQTENGVLAAGRQLGTYVISADLIDLRNFDPAAEKEFRIWLMTIRSTNVGTHSRWKSITQTCENAAANWGTFACASRIAASIYLGDTADVNRAANIIRAFLGERAAYPANAPGRNGYFEHTAGYDPSWACNDAAWTGINPGCVKSGVNLDGVLVEDAARGGGCCTLQGSGISYSWEALQGLFVSVELLYRTGAYGDPYQWSNQALKRAVDFMQRSGWGISNAATYVPWMANYRYGTAYPAQASFSGRIMSWGDWMYQR